MGKGERKKTWSAGKRKEVAKKQHSEYVEHTGTSFEGAGVAARAKIAAEAADHPELRRLCLVNLEKLRKSRNAKRREVNARKSAEQKEQAQASGESRKRESAAHETRRGTGGRRAVAQSRGGAAYARG